MKVLVLQQVLLVLVFVFCVYVATYATAAEANPQQQQQQPQQTQQQAARQRRRQQQAVTQNGNVAEETLKFGTKISEKQNLNQTSQTKEKGRHEYRGSVKKPTVASTITAAPRIARRYDAPEPPKSQLIDQFEIPLNNKNPTSSQYNRRQRLRGQDNAAIAKPVTSSSIANSSGAKSERTKLNYKKTGMTAGTTTSTATTTTSSSTTSRPNFIENLQRNNPFSFLQQSFFNLSRTPNQADTTKKPPKKYTPSPIPTSNAKSDKSRGYIKSPKLRSTALTPTETTTTLKQDYADEPFKIAIPTLNFFAPQTEKKTKYVGRTNSKDKGKRQTVAELREQYVCPRESEVRFQLFPKICKEDVDCVMWNREELCCDIFGAKSCVKGAPKPLKEDPHAPLLGLIPRKCPERPLAELWWDLQECDTDDDCWPRVCCPDGRRRYCRTAQPDMDVVPAPVQRSLNYLSEYLECTPPPPKIFDLYPQACTTTFDCFPNVCCQEAGLRFCRPPKKSVLTLMANVLNVDVVRRLTQNIVIK